MNILVRDEQPADIVSITRLTETAFRDRPYASGTEQVIVNALRHHGQLTISLVAVDGEEIVGHVAVSPVTISSGATGWYGLGPISVWPERQRQGIGSTLVRAALAELRRRETRGCVLLGDPGYYPPASASRPSPAWSCRASRPCPPGCIVRRHLPRGNRALSRGVRRHIVRICTVCF